MYVITHKEKPATLGKLYKLEQKHLHDQREEHNIIAGRTKQAAIEGYLHHFGFTWAERTPNVEVAECGYNVTRMIYDKRIA